MAPTPQQAEAASAAGTYHVAMAMVGAQAFAETLELWDQVVPTSTRMATTSAQFIAAVMKLLRRRRHQIQALTIPYLRLHRALHTGATFQPVFVDEPETITLDALRNDFERALQRFAPDALQTSVVQDPYPDDAVDDSFEVLGTDGSRYTPWRRTVRGGDVLTEEIDRLQQELDQIEADAEQEAQVVIEALAKDLLAKKLKELNSEALTADEADAKQEEAHGMVGRRVAAHIERMAQNGGRHAMEGVARIDRRCVGYVRVHHPQGDIEPCSFCAMLISRGAVYKKSTAEKRDTRDNSVWQMWREGFDVPGAEFDKYHPLCHCTGEPVYSFDQIEKDPRYDVNRELAKLWAKEIAAKGYTGKTAEAEWRQLIKARNEKLRQERGGTEHSHV